MEEKSINSVLVVLMMVAVGGYAILADNGSNSDSKSSEDEGQQMDDEWEVYYVDSGDDLPTCDSTTLGHLYYVAATAGFETCTSAGWQFIDLTGPTGPAGVDGADGVGIDGADGVDGADGSASTNTMLTIVSSPETGCAAGGRVISQGLDNGDGKGIAQNGVLEPGEVDYSTSFCSDYELRQVEDIWTVSNPEYDAYDYYYSSWIGELMEILVGDTIYFSAYSENFQVDLWAHDTTTGSTWQVTDMGGEYNGSRPSNPMLVGDTIYFSAYDVDVGFELWAHDTSNASTWLVADICAGDCSSSAWSPNLVGDKIYFRADDGISGKELWAHDTTNGRTWQVTDINAGDGDSYPGSRMLIVVEDIIYFDASNVFSGSELWAHDTSSGLTWQVSEIKANGSSNPGRYFHMLVGDTIYFDADDQERATELWAHDTSNASTWLVADIRKSEYWSNGHSNPGRCVTILVGDTIYFDAHTNGYGTELWAHDTSNASTWLVADIDSFVSSSGYGANGNPGCSGYNLAMSILVDDTIYFSADDGLSGAELWAHDTSNASTWQVADICAGECNSRPGRYMQILFDDTIFFSANGGRDDGGDDVELWAHDTSNGFTWQVADINSATDHSDGSSHPGSGMTILVGDTLYFNAYSELNGNEFWSMEIEHTITYN